MNLLFRTQLTVDHFATGDPPDGVVAVGARQGILGRRQRLGMSLFRVQSRFALWGLCGRVIPSRVLRDDPEGIVAVLGRDTSCSFVLPSAAEE